MRRVIVGLFGSVVLLLVVAGSTNAQDPFQDAIKQLSSDNVKGYVQPFIDGFGANLNSGLYRTAEIGDGIHVELRLVAIGTMIGDAEKVYTATVPAPYNQTQQTVQTATVFGDMGAAVANPADHSIRYHFQNGQVRTSWIPLGTPQLEVGTVFGTQAIVRYVPIPEIGDFPKVTLLGFGVRHNISRYLPTVPVDLAASAFYQTFKIGDIFDAKAFSFGAQASKSYSVLTLYGGIQYESSTVTLSYTYTGPPVQGTAQNSSVSVDLDGGNKVRLTAGLGINLAILHLNADINVGKVTVATAGLGFGL